jgi:hypothetical protein
MYSAAFTKHSCAMCFSWTCIYGLCLSIQLVVSDIAINVNFFLSIHGAEYTTVGNFQQCHITGQFMILYTMLVWYWYFKLG